MTAPVVVVAGEALIDLIEADGALHPHPGGGPFNTAVALGRLEVPVAFLGRLSEDPFGRLLSARLDESGVDPRYLLRGPAPTPLAVVHTTAAGDHEFGFYLAGTAYAALAPGDLPTLDPGVAALYVGTLALATDPPATAFERLIRREADRRLVVIDPNIRSSVCGNREAYVRRFDSWVHQAHVIKLSDDDADWLFPGMAYDAVVDEILARGARLVVLTLGDKGALARTPAVGAWAASPRVDVVDTVGAGDAFGAGLLRGLRRADRLDPGSLAEMDAGDLQAVLRFATAVAALQCTRAGASPPSLAEVERFLGAQARGDVTAT